MFKTKAWCSLISGVSAYSCAGEQPAVVRGKVRAYDDQVKYQTFTIPSFSPVNTSRHHSSLPTPPLHCEIETQDEPKKGSLRRTYTTPGISLSWTSDCTALRIALHRPWYAHVHCELTTTGSDYLSRTYETLMGTSSERFVSKMVI